MSNIISSYIRSAGQEFLNDEIDIKFIKEKIIKLEETDLDFLKEDKNFGIEIVNSYKNKKPCFPISNHERHYLLYHNSVKDMLLYLVFRYKFYLSSIKKQHFKSPLYILIELVSACNLRCPFCFQSDKTFTKKPYMGVMNYDLAKKILDDADENKVGAITFASRGEPTMHPKFTEILKYATSKKNIMEIKINSNGTFLNEKICNSIFENKINTIVISADHYLKKDYERLRKGANFEDVVNKVSMLSHIKKKFKNSLTEIRISGVNADKNIDEKKFKEFWLQYSDSVTIGDCIERWNTYDNNETNINTACSRLWDRMYIWYDGKCNPCDEDYKSYLSYGNIVNSSIQNIWNSEKLNELRNKHIDKKRKDLEPCKRCPFQDEN